MERKSIDMYDVFISYRRDGGYEMARLIYENLHLKNIKCFLDVEELGSGTFNSALFKNIEESKNFVLILSPNSLERCKNDEDWVRNEIEHAIKENKNIIPVMMPGFEWPEFLPESMEGLSYYNGVQIVREYFGASITKLINMLILDREINTTTPAQTGSAGSARVVSAINSKSLLERAFMFLEAGEWNKADKYAEKVLDVEPKNAEAYLVKLLSELKVYKRESLKNLEQSFDYSPTYETLLRYAGEALKEELEGYLKNIKRRINRKYEKAKAEFEAAKTADDFEKVSQKFLELGNYLDSNEYLKKCNAKINSLKYKQAKSKMKAARTKEEYMRVSNEFSFISYRDSSKLAEKCHQNANMIEKLPGEGMFKHGKITEIEIANGVTAIGDSAFAYCTELTSIELPHGVCSIGKEAFLYCDKLTSINIPNTVTSIGDRAFEGCKNLTSVTIPDSVKYIGESAFYCCENLLSINIPDSVEWISENTFYLCKSLFEINLGNGLKSIKKSAFYGCVSLEKITIPESVTEIGESAFSECRKLVDISLPKSLQKIEDYSFNRCAITELIIPDGVKSIGSCAFTGCEALRSIVIPQSVTKIDMRAFSFCTNLLRVKLPVSIQILGDDAFPMTKTIIYDGTRSQWYAIKKGYGFKNLNVVCADGVVATQENTASGNFSNNATPQTTSYNHTPTNSSTPPSANNSTPKPTSNGCYIATCVYGSYDCPQVWMLRRFRDESLASNVIGRCFIRFYYAVSPTLVKWFGKNRIVTRTWKVLVDKLVFRLREKGVSDTPYDDKEWNRKTKR